jgi:D-tyrosyl-tRNA(Tyr) deacylase
MKAVVQRVTRARVVVHDDDGGETVAGEIGAGMVVLVCVLRGDGEKEARALAKKIAEFRFFADDQGRMNVSALERGLEALVVSQFTLAAEGDRGRRPSFDRAAVPERARELYELFVRELEDLGLPVRTGRFAARMEVTIVNDGPVTFVLETGPCEGGQRKG